MKKNQHEIMFGFIKQTFFTLLSLVDHELTWLMSLMSKPCISLNNKLYMTRPTVNYLNPDEYM